MNKRGKYPKNYIKELRENRGWKLRDLEDRTGWSNQTVSNLELSKAELKYSQLMKLAEVFECHPLEITEGPESQVMAQTQSEKELLEAFRGLDDSAKSMYLHGLRTFKNAAPAEQTDIKKDQLNKEKKSS